MKENKEKTLKENYRNFRGLDDVELERIMTPKNDYIFKRLFGQVGKERLVKDFLEAVLNIKIKDIKLGNETILLPEEMEGKTGILDVRVTLEDKTEVDIEIQNGSLEYLVKRMHFYLARLYESSLKTGTDYSQLRKSVVICIANFEVLSEIKRYHTIWKMTEQTEKESIFDEFELHFIELPKFLNTKMFNTKRKLDQWLLFIDYSKRELIKEIMEENENVKEAEKNLQEIKSDKHNQYLAWLHEKYILEKNTALKAGIEQGIEQGTKQEKRKVAKKMLMEKFEISIISKITGLTEKEILELKQGIE